MFRNLVRAAATPAALAAILGFCSGSNAASSANSKSASAQTTIYVTNSCTNEVTAYPIGSNGNVSPLRAQVALGPPTGIAIGPSGQIFVSDICRRVAVYAPGSNGVAPPIGVIAGRNTGLTGPFASAINTGVALDRDGNVYVLSGQRVNNPGPEPTKVLVFSAGTYGNAAPIRTISGPHTDLSWYPVGIAVDSKGQVYVATASTDDSGGGDSVLVFAAGSDGDAAPIAVIEGSKNSGLFSIGSMTVDSTGNIYVANASNCYYFCPDTAHITVYAPGGNGDVAPSASIAGPHTGLGFVGPIAIAPDGKVYVVTLRQIAKKHGVVDERFIEVFPAGSHGDVAPVVEFQVPENGPFAPSAIAFGPDGKLYVANSDPRSVTVYAPGSSGNFKPVSTIADPTNRINVPSGVAVSSGGALYVSNAGPYVTRGSSSTCGSVVSYPAKSLARGRPSLTIAGLQADLNCPRAIALDLLGDVYVEDHDSVNEYTAGRHGDVAPTADIPTGTSFGLAVDSHRNIYASYVAPGGVTIFGASGGNHRPQLGTIGGSNTGIVDPGALATDRNNNIYVVNGDSSGTNIRKYRAGSIGNVAPIAVINVSNPSGLAVDDQGNLYVLDNSGDVITVYPAGGNGDVAPIATINGANTGLAGPSGIAFGP